MKFAKFVICLAVPGVVALSGCDRAAPTNAPTGSVPAQGGSRPTTYAPYTTPPQLGGGNRPRNYEGYLDELDKRLSGGEVHAPRPPEVRLPEIRLPHPHL